MQSLLFCEAISFFVSRRLIAWLPLLRWRSVLNPRFFVVVVLLAAALLPPPPRALAVTDEEKRKAFLQSQTHGGDKANSAAHPKKKKKSKPKPAVRKHPAPVPEATPEPARPATTPVPTPTPGAANAVLVEKSGVVEEEPAPAPESERRRWWWPFGGGARYKYLSRAVRDAIDDAHVARHRWRYIVVHNSGTQQGNAKAFDYYHRKVRKMPNGLAYHFVIGNGTSSGNGAIEVGPRWVGQINGGHVHSDYLNSIALGVCLVGDYNREKPTREQLEALDELVQYLRKRVGKTDHKLAIVKPHRDINPPQWPTDCPGDRFPYEWLNAHFD